MWFRLIVQSNSQLRLRSSGALVLDNDPESGIVPLDPHCRPAPVGGRVLQQVAQLPSQRRRQAGGGTRPVSATAMSCPSEREACRLTVTLLALAHEENCEGELAAAIDSALKTGRLPDPDAPKARFALRSDRMSSGIHVASRRSPEIGLRAGSA